MKILSSVFLLVVATGVVSAFTTSDAKGGRSTATTNTNTASSSSSGLEASKTEDFTTTRSRFNPSGWIQNTKRTKKPRSKCGPCPADDEDDDDDMANTLENLFSNNNKNDDVGTSSNNAKEVDRREAAFAMLGSLWAATATTTFQPAPANAVYGADAKIEMPNVMQGLSDRATKQCLVESLGNRECLVYMDPDNQLYQGANTQKLLEKIDFSSQALTRIPELVETKKWMNIKSILAGPMGELLSTMNLLAPLSTKQPDKSTSLAKQVNLLLVQLLKKKMGLLS